MKAKRNIAMAISTIIFVLFVLYSCNHEKGEVTFAEQYLTAKNTQSRILQIENLELGEDKYGDTTQALLIIDPYITFQTIEGFGGSLTDAAAETFYKLSKTKQQELLAAYTDKKEGIAYTFFRTNINSCDFSSESYAYSEVDNDINLDHFTIQKDKKFKIPFIKEIHSNTGVDFKLLASPWSPPAWMKTNNHMLNGGKLKPEYYQTWANYYIKYIDAYKKEKIPIWGLTMHNEPMIAKPWESCVYSETEEHEFIDLILRPTLSKHKKSYIKTLMWDHKNRNSFCESNFMENNPYSGTGFYWSEKQKSGSNGNTNPLDKDYNIFLKSCTNNFNHKNIDNWVWGEIYGTSLFEELNNSAVAWIDWNILLDENGGPNHAANYCYAPIIGNTETNELIYMNTYYYIGHFSKFIYPGAKRIRSEENNCNFLSTVFLNKDGSIVLVAMNKEEEGTDFKVNVKGKSTKIKLPANSIKTLVFK